MSTKQYQPMLIQINKAVGIRPHAAQSMEHCAASQLGLPVQNVPPSDRTRSERMVRHFGTAHTLTFRILSDTDGTAGQCALSPLDGPLLRFQRTSRKPSDHTC